MSDPNHLRKDDKVAIVATAKRMEYDHQLALDTLVSWGLVPVMGKHPLKHAGYFAGTDQEKLDDLHWALNDPEIKAIIFLRGGYGTSKIIDQVDFASFRDQPKWLVGFSDLTAMILQLDVFGIPMIHGPMCVLIGKNNPSDLALKKLLFGSDTIHYNCFSHTEGQASGRIVGGNLSMIYESIGAQNEIQTNGNILFLEDVGEQMYGIDRMMTKLKRIGKLNELSGVVLGSFTSIGNVNDYFTESIEELIISYIPEGIPIATSLNAGHEEENLSLMMNKHCEVLISQNNLQISYL